jgi:hypothetical protein
MDQRLDELPTEPGLHWPKVEVGTTVGTTAKRLDQSVAAVCGVRGVTGEPGVIGAFLQPGATAVMGLPLELRSPEQRAGATVAATVEAAAQRGLQLMADGEDPSGELARAAAWAWRTYPDVGAGGGVGLRQWRPRGASEEFSSRSTRS